MLRQQDDFIIKIYEIDQDLSWDEVNGIIESFMYHMHIYGIQLREKLPFLELTKKERIKLLHCLFVSNSKYKFLHEVEDEVKKFIFSYLDMNLSADLIQKSLSSLNSIKWDYICKLRSKYSYLGMDSVYILSLSAMLIDHYQYILSSMNYP